MIANFIEGFFKFDPNNPLLFTQFYFWAFFAIVFGLLCLFKNKIILRNAFLFFVSVFFYYKTSGIFTLILLFITAFNFFEAKWIYKQQNESKKKFILVIGLVVNLLTLCYFKYSYFLIDVLNNIIGTHFKVVDVFAIIGNGITGGSRFMVDSIMLPVGISFYIFQTISYIIDVYRRDIEPVDNFLDFGFYATFFPQLVAGPIVRASEFISQLHKKFFLSRRQFGIAVFWIVNGLVKKIVMSDYLAINFIDRVFDNPLLFTGFENLSALFGYSLQVYADFSGYTDIAIGVAMLMGFYLPKNFNSPYKAMNPGEFWSRWHISLSRWLKDYLYIPLGGNRNATFGTYVCIITIAIIACILSGSVWVSVVVGVIAVALILVARFRKDTKKVITTNINLMNTMLLGGLWHGASWNFMIWGGLNGLGIVTYKIWRKRNITEKTVAIFVVFAIFAILSLTLNVPFLNIVAIWSGVFFIGTLIKFIYCRFFDNGNWDFSKLERVWAIGQTFIFITFTRLFFRSGSNLDPADANETAWNTAKAMVQRIGSKWSMEQIPVIIHEYSNIFIIILIGMIIHWLPENFKRRYRIWFANMPLVLMGIVVLITVFLLYQFVSADLMKFIYFQF